MCSNSFLILHSENDFQRAPRRASRTVRGGSLQCYLGQRQTGNNSHGLRFTAEPQNGKIEPVLNDGLILLLRWQMLTVCSDDLSRPPPSRGPSCHPVKFTWELFTLGRSLTATANHYLNHSLHPFTFMTKETVYKAEDHRL